MNISDSFLTYGRYTFKEKICESKTTKKQFFKALICFIVNCRTDLMKQFVRNPRQRPILKLLISLVSSPPCAAQFSLRALCLATGSVRAGFKDVYKPFSAFRNLLEFANERINFREKLQLF
jgi:hypothetical protein